LQLSRTDTGKKQQVSSLPSKGDIPASHGSSHQSGYPSSEGQSQSARAELKDAAVNTDSTWLKNTEDLQHELEKTKEAHDDLQARLASTKLELSELAKAAAEELEAKELARAASKELAELTRGGSPGALSFRSSKEAASEELEAQELARAASKELEELTRVGSPGALSFRSSREAVAELAAGECEDLDVTRAHAPSVGASTGKNALHDSDMREALQIADWRNEMHGQHRQLLEVSLQEEKALTARLQAERKIMESHLKCLQGDEYAMDELSLAELEKLEQECVFALSRIQARRNERRRKEDEERREKKRLRHMHVSRQGYCVSTMRPHGVLL